MRAFFFAKDYIFRLFYVKGSRKGAETMIPLLYDVFACFLFVSMHYRLAYFLQKSPQGSKFGNKCAVTLLHDLE